MTILAPLCSVARPNLKPNFPFLSFLLKERGKDNVLLYYWSWTTLHNMLGLGIEIALQNPIRILSWMYEKETLFITIARILYV